MNKNKYCLNDKTIKEFFSDIRLLGINTDNIDIYDKALHIEKVPNSSKGKNNKTYTNESLAMLGDAVLSLVVIDYLYDKKYDKKKIDNKKKEIVNNNNLCKIRENLKIKKYIHNNKYNFDDMPDHEKLPCNEHDQYVEAIIGAIYIDQGLKVVKEWINKEIIDKSNLG